MSMDPCNSDDTGTPANGPDENKNGVPDRFEQLLYNEQFGPNNWENRRKIVFRCLSLCAVLITMIVAVFLIGALYSMVKNQPVDAAVASILSTAIYALVGLASAVIGSYVFGATFDTKSFRENIMSLVRSGS